MGKKRWDPILGTFVDEDPFPYIPDTYKPPKVPIFDDFYVKTSAPPPYPSIKTQRPYDPLPFPSTFTLPPPPPRLRTPPHPIIPPRTPPLFPVRDPFGGPGGPQPGFPPIGSLPPPKIGS